MSRIIYFLLIFPVFSATGQQTIGLPVIENFGRHSYGAGTQNWNFVQARSGILYAANNEGVLSYDGTNWKLYPLPNRTIVRSLMIGTDNKLYVGGQDEVGFFSPNALGELEFHSLKTLIPPKHQSFNDIWQIKQSGQDIFFRSTDKIFRLANEAIDVFPASDRWVFMEIVDRKLLVQDQTQGLLEFSHGNWNRFPLTEDLPPAATVTSITSLSPDSTLITTWKHGLYLLHKKRLTSFPVRNLPDPTSFSSSLLVDGEFIALGTNNSGCLIIDREGNLVQQFARKSGIQNNSVISIFGDSHQNIWLGLENGIDFIAFNNAIKQINPESIGEGAGYAAMVNKNNLYLGLSNGVFKLSLQGKEDLSYTQASFRLVPNTAGQIWGLSEVNGDLFAGSHEGAFLINDDQAELIARGTGYWNFLPASNSFPAPLILGGNYTGIEQFAYKHKVAPLGGIPEFAESARFIAIDNHNAIWTSHPYRGVYRIEEKEGSQPQLFTEAHGLPSRLNNHVYKIKGRVLVATPQGIYEFDGVKEVFSPSEYFKKIFGTINIRYLREDPSGNIWFISDKQVGVVEFSASVPRMIYLPELNNKMIGGFEHIYPLDRKNIFLGAEKGFYHINLDKYKKHNHRLDLLIRQVQVSGWRDSLLFGGYFSEVNDTISRQTAGLPKIPFNLNSFSFNFSSILYEQQSNIEYRYLLEGFDNQWADWSKRTQKDYTNLPAGDYVFRVQSRNNLGNESSEAIYAFSVLPPWYRSGIAYLIYGLLVCIGAYLLYKIQQKRLKNQQSRHLEEQKKLQYLHQLELEKSEKQIMQLKNEQLEREIGYKNSELATTAMHLVQKGEFLSRIKTELLRLNKIPQNQEVVSDLKKLIRNFSEEEKIDEDWEQFAVHFDKFHSDFLVALKEAYPALTPNELKLCAYLRMNLSSKEIAQLMNISVRGIEISRYRLRKKLAISTETNLFQFLLGFQNEPVKPSGNGAEALKN